MRLSSETSECSLLNSAISNEECDWWLLELGVSAGSFYPGEFFIDDLPFVAYDAVSGPGCSGTSGSMLLHSLGATFTILEVTATTATVQVTGVSTDDMTGHEVNGTYTALRCDAP